MEHWKDLLMVARMVDLMVEESVDQTVGRSVVRLDQ